MMKCVGFEALIDYLDGRLPGPEQKRVTRHLASGCKECAASRAWYEQVRTLLRTDKTEDAPPWVIKRAVRLYEASAPAKRSVAKAARGVLHLIFDSLKQPAMVGARSAAAAPRQLLYSVDDYSIDLQIAASGSSRADLIGQILSAAEPGFDLVSGISVGLSRKGKPVHSTATDQVGIFVIKKIERGRYDLTIEARDMTINVTGLTVSTPKLN